MSKREIVAREIRRAMLDNPTDGGFNARAAQREKIADQAADAILAALAAQQDGVREIGNCGGIKIIADKDVPDDVLELHHADGRVDRYKLVSGLEQTEAMRRYPLILK